MKTACRTHFRALVWALTLSVMAAGGGIAVAQTEIELVPVPEGQEIGGIEISFEEFQALLGPEKFAAWQLEQFDRTNPGLRAEVDRLIQKVGQSDLETISATLHDYHDPGYKDAFDAGLDANRIEGGSVEARGCMADRRLARMYEILAAMPPEQAERTCKELFEKKLKINRDAYMLRFQEIRTAPDKPATLMGVNWHALQCSVLLTAMFCDGPTLLDQLDRWRLGNMIFKAQSLVEGRSIPMYYSTLEHGEPDALFIVHCLMISLEQQGRLTPEVLQTAQTLELPRLEQVQMLDWRAPVTRGGIIGPADVPAIKNRIRPLKTFTLTWYWMGKGAFDLDTQNRLIGYLRTTLLNPDAVNQEPTPAQQ